MVRRASGIQVYGVDDRFWAFQGVDPEIYPLGRRDVFVSEGLARELEAAVDDTLLVRVEMPSAIPISSLHGRREDSGRTLRLGIDRVLTAAEHGEFSFRPQQGLARSVFVSLTRLQQVLEQEGKVNTVLLGVPTGGGLGLDRSRRLTAAEAAVREVASLQDVGLRVRTIPEQGQLRRRGCCRAPQRCDGVGSRDQRLESRVRTSARPHLPGERNTSRRSRYAVFTGRRTRS